LEHRMLLFHHVRSTTLSATKVIPSIVQRLRRSDC
jgi:hypothetical protein